MEDTKFTPSLRPVALHSLAIVGFIALLGAGMWFAVYSAKYVPNIVGSLGTAAVSLSQIFKPAPTPGLSVVPTASTTISFGGSDAPTSTPATTPTPVVTKPVVARAPGQETSGVFPIGSVPTTLSGLPDLTVRINQVGYLPTTSTDSFIASSTVPAGSRPAVKFTISNVGTNVATSWRFSAAVPARTAFLFQSQQQQALNPGDSIQYTLGFDQADSGVDQIITVTANFDSAIRESNIENNSAVAQVTIGS